MKIGAGYFGSLEQEEREEERVRLEEEEKVWGQQEGKEKNEDRRR